MKLLLMGIRQKTNSEYELKVWEDPWIPTTPGGPVRLNALVVHPRMTVSDLINGETKE